MYLTIGGWARQTPSLMLARSIFLRIHLSVQEGGFES